MTQQTFPISGRHPRVVINGLEGQLNVQPWEKQEISVSTDGPVEVLRQDGDTVTITGCKSDLELWIPSSINRVFSSITTDIIGTALSRGASIERAGNVELKEVGGSVTLKDTCGNAELTAINEGAELSNVGGNLRAAHMPRLQARGGVGGNGTLLDIGQAEIDMIGGNLWVTSVGSATISTVGGDLDVEQVESALNCRTVGGNCEVRNSASAQVNVHNVGGNMFADGTLLAGLCNVGGNMKVQASFTAESRGRFHVGGNASIVLPENANLTVHAIVGGSASGPEAIYSHGGGFVDLVYGDGVARLDLTVGGNLRLSGTSTPRSVSGSDAWRNFGSDMANFGMEIGKMGRKISREILKSLGE
ncbi:MAG TPA: hypothetical protein VFB60_22310 [Ktedonobacteraceae bacterium]|nr:hypothetical protein [Ktedonobacteraceae bacterium]